MHSPLRRAEETARVILDQLNDGLAKSKLAVKVDTPLQGVVFPELAEVGGHCLCSVVVRTCGCIVLVVGERGAGYGKVFEVVFSSYRCNTTIVGPRMLWGESFAKFGLRCSIWFSIVYRSTVFFDVYWCLVSRTCDNSNSPIRACPASRIRI